jgi:hypothetical protein
VVYSYTINATDPANGSVSFALTSGPTNAIVNGNVLTWTPSHAQSRVSNSFTITATTTEHASTTQIFSVAPAGNINGAVNYVDYTATGKILVPDTSITTVLAFVPDGKGSYTTIQGTANAGAFSIPGVPPGSFMLEVGDGKRNNQLLWTSVSDVDMSVALQGRVDASYPAVPPTLNVHFSVPQAGSPETCNLVVPNLGPDTYLTKFDVLTCNSQWRQFEDWSFGLADPAKGDQTYVYADLPVADLLNHTWTGHSLADFAGPFDLQIADGANVDFSGSMTAQAPNASVRANLAVAQLVSLSSAISPNFTVAGSPDFLIGVQPFTSDYYLSPSPAPVNWGIGTRIFQIAPLFLYPYSTGYNTDADLGDVSYANPFPAAWPAYASLRLLGQVPYLADGATYPTQMWGGIVTVTLNMPTAGSPIGPLVGPPTAVKIDGNDFFQSQPNASTQPVVSWNPPSVGTPDGYSLSIIQLKKTGTITKAGTVFTIYTTQDSITIPPELLEPGSAYAFQLEAFKGNPNVETAPRYSSFPWGYADAFSGTIHVSQ